MAPTPSVPVLPTIGETTGQQVITRFPVRLFGCSHLPASYATYREMRKHPTIALARSLAVAPVVVGEWSVKADDDVPDSLVEFVTRQFMPLREQYVETAMLGGIDFGYQGFEQVFEYAPSGQIRLRKLKPLIQDNTEIEIDAQTGAFAGFRQDKLLLPLSNSLCVSFRVEGTDWYGQSLLENARKTWNQWNDANDGAARYDRKLAGSHWVVYYPAGVSRDATGAEQDNALIAASILATLESSGSVAVPTDVTAYADQLDQENRGWKIDIMADSSGRQPTFIDRLKYLDCLLVRALLQPERSLIEAQYGTKAEAETHGDLATINAELAHRHVTRLLTWHSVDRLVVLNYGLRWRNKVRLMAAPLRDATREYLRLVYDKFLSNPSGFMEESGTIDTDALKDALGVPKAEEVAAAGDQALDGVDANDPLAATTRRVYAQLQATQSAS